MWYNRRTGFSREEERFMFDTLTWRIKHDSGDSHYWANLSLKVAGVLATAMLVFVALYFFVQALE
jgi:hypothetical protein